MLESAHKSFSTSMHCYVLRYRSLKSVRAPTGAPAASRHHRVQATPSRPRSAPGPCCVVCSTSRSLTSTIQCTTRKATRLGSWVKRMRYYIRFAHRSRCRCATTLLQWSKSWKRPWSRGHGPETRIDDVASSTHRAGAQASARAPSSRLHRSLRRGAYWCAQTRRVACTPQAPHRL